MPATKPSHVGSYTISALALILLFVCNLSAGTSYTVLYRFGGETDGSNPEGNLIFDGFGNLYGTTVGTGSAGPCNPGGGCGSVFELTPSNGKWIETTLYDFCSSPNCADGASPYYGLIRDREGNLYGTTTAGGAGPYGCCGVVFELSHSTSGKWAERVLYTFDGETDGKWPSSGLTADTKGNLYGTTEDGGSRGAGTVFRLSRPGGGWKETILHNFPENISDGGYPEGNLVFDSKGNLYGTTNGGGIYEYGIVFELSPSGGDEWTESILNSFDIVDGMYPDAGVTLGREGELYGTTTEGGNPLSLGGVIFNLGKLDGLWTESVLYDFLGKEQSMAITLEPSFSPEGGLVMDRVGNIYGVTDWGGMVGDGCTSNGCGTVFELTHNQQYVRNLNVLYRFCMQSNCSDGKYPWGGLVFDSAGNIYGTTVQGGTEGCNKEGCGTVFEVINH